MLEAFVVQSEPCANRLKANWSSKVNTKSSVINSSTSFQVLNAWRSGRFSRNCFSNRMCSSGCHSRYRKTCYNNILINDFFVSVLSEFSVFSKSRFEFNPGSWETPVVAFENFLQMPRVVPHFLTANEPFLKN